MKTYTSLFLLAALGVMSGAATAAVDTSAWVCESCPFPTGASGAVEVGVGHVSDPSAKFGDFTGLQKDGAHLVLGGQLSQRSAGGYWADLQADRLGLDSRTLKAQVGREGLYRLSLGYRGIPRHLGEGQTPFLGIGGAALTLPAGFSPATAAASLKPVDLSYDFERTEVGATYLGQPNWVWSVNTRRDARSGLKPVRAYATGASSQLAAPIEHSNDQVEVSGSYVTRKLQATVGYQASRFRNDHQSLSWANPFAPGATSQMALAPDNQFHQVFGKLGYAITPAIRASADLAVGRMTQDQDYLTTAGTTLPAANLDGRVDTFNGSVKLSADLRKGLRVNAAYLRDVRDNRSPVLSYTTVSPVGTLGSVSNTPFDLTQDRFKVDAQYRAADGVKLSGGLDHDQRARNYLEDVKTRETTLWGKASIQAAENVGLVFKLATADRTNNGYGTAAAGWLSSPENPLMRKTQLAPRGRDTAGLRADIAVTETISIGLNADLANDNYRSSVLGLRDTRSANLGVDLSHAISETTQLTLFAQGERARSRQAGSQAFAAPDWTAEHKDRFTVLGLGFKTAAIPDKLDIGADLSFARTRGEVAVVPLGSDPAFPTNRSSLDGAKLYAIYKLSDKLSFKGSWWYEDYSATDWQLDGVMPTSVYNLLSMGLQAPQYRVHAVQFSMRYAF